MPRANGRALAAPCNLGQSLSAPAQVHRSPPSATITSNRVIDRNGPIRCWPGSAPRLPAAAGQRLDATHTASADGGLLLSLSASDIARALGKATASFIGRNPSYLVSKNLWLKPVDMSLQRRSANYNLAANPGFTNLLSRRVNSVNLLVSPANPTIGPQASAIGP